MNLLLRVFFRTINYRKDLGLNNCNTVLKKNINTFINYQVFSSNHLKIGGGIINIVCTQFNAFHKTNIICKKRKTKEERKAPLILQYPITSKFKEKRVIHVWKNMTVQQLADSMETDAGHIFDVMEFVDNSIYYTKPSDVINNWQVIQDVVQKTGLRFKLIKPPDDLEVEEISKDLTRRPPAAPENMIRRPPVVTIMGHVDHGKTTLLDYLRNSSVVDTEFGGITQHIGAFSVKLNNGDKITFLDTPGHAAFSAMRNRGAQATDIVVLVVAADDGVMEQTVESIKMAKEAQVPIIVAINKIDKPQADIERTQKMLIQQGILLEAIGGDVQAVPISALKGTNINILIDSIILQAELMDIKADYSGLVEGVVIESSTDLHRGKLATILVDRGTLRKGAILIAGTSWARVRAMFDDAQQTVQEVTPGFSVQLIGWRSLPSAGDIILEVQSEKQAQQIIRWRENNKMKEKQAEDIVDISSRTEEYNKIYKAKLEEKRKLGRYKIRRDGPRQKEIIENDELKLNIIIKGDVDGSVEAIMDVLETYSSSLCKLDVVHYGVGSVTINDVELAEMFKAVIYTFNIGTLKESVEKAKTLNIKIKHHNIIYRLVDDLIEEIEKLIPAIDVEEILGEANVLQHFVITEGKKKVSVAGCRCTKGLLKKSALYKVVRGSEIVYQGTLESMRHLKNEVDSIKKDIECGLRFSDVTIEFLPGDTIVCYNLKKLPKKLDWNPGF